MIRGYEFPQIESKILCEEISPGAMCKGPDGTILIFDNMNKSLKQLRYCDGQFLLAKEFFVEFADVHRLCFSENCGHVIVLHDGRKTTLTGFYFPSGQVAWQHNDVQLEPSSQVLTIWTISVLPDGRVCVFNYDKIFALNPVDGTIL